MRNAHRLKEMSTKEHGQFEANYNLQIDPKALLSAVQQNCFSSTYCFVLKKKPILHFPVGGTLLAPTTNYSKSYLTTLNEYAIPSSQAVKFLSEILMMH